MPGSVDVDLINAMLAEHYPGTGNRCVEVGADYAVVACDVTPDDIRPGGFVSGPTQFAVADCALWFATFVGLGRIEPMALTSELSIRYLRPAIGSRIVGRATVESISRRSVVGTVHVWSADHPDKITATAQGTYAIPLPR